MTKSPRSLAVLFITIALGVCWISSPAYAQADQLTVQVASYLRASDADAAVKRLRARKLDAYWVKAEIPGMGTRYRVRIGKFSDDNDATIGAADACKVRAISEYMIAKGDVVPTGVPAKTCKFAYAEVARIKAKSKTDEHLVKAPVTTKKESKEPAAKPSAPAAVQTKATVIVNPAANSPKSNSPIATNATPPNSASKSPANVPTKSVTAGPIEIPEPVFVAAASPRDIARNAYKYALARSAKGSPIAKELTNTVIKSPKPPAIAAPSSVNSLIARSAVASALTADVAIANPKWKISQTELAGDKNLRAVHFVDAWTGWAAGDSGTIFQTIDGGQSWNQIRTTAISNSEVDINRIYFASENKGWMLGEVNKSVGAKTVLLSTEDGGKIWQQREAPNVTSFHFIDDKKGWAVGKNATLLKTTDGGMRWKTVANIQQLVSLPVESASSKFGFSDVYFLKGGDIGWAVGNFVGNDASNIGGLFMTVDGGENWQRIPIAVQRKINSTRFTKGRLDSVRFTDVSNGVITGEMEDGDEKFFFTLKTRNGGETWEQARVQSNSFHNTQFVDVSRGWTAASARREGSADAKVYDTVLLRTDNGGKSWVTDFVARGKQIHSVFFISPSRGWAVGDRGMIMRYDAQ